MKLYKDLTVPELREMAESWTRECWFDRHANVWLMEHGYDWDPSKSDKENRADFQKVADMAFILVPHFPEDKTIDTGEAGE